MMIMQWDWVPDEHHLILVGVIGLVFKIIWDWLASPRAMRRAERVEKHIDHVEKMNGHMEAAIEDIKVLTAEMNDRQKRIWEHILTTEATAAAASAAATVAATAASSHAAIAARQAWSQSRKGKK
jgi:type II secretory pathway component PulM